MSSYHGQSPLWPGDVTPPSGRRGGGDGGEEEDKIQQTVVNMLSMLTLGMDGKDQDQEQQTQQRSMSVDGQRLLLLNMANTPESCLTLRRAGCIPLLVNLIHPQIQAQDQDQGIIQTPEIIQVRAARALKNIVQFNPDEKEKKKELRVLRLLEGIRLFTEAVKGLLKKEEQEEEEEEVKGKMDNIQHPTTSLSALTKLSFDEEHRITMCLLGAIHALADLLVSDHFIHGNDPQKLKEDCLILRRLTGRALTNLTVYNKTNKALLCGMKGFLECLVNQLDCGNEEICQISANVLRNLSWKVDSVSKSSLAQVQACSKLMMAAIKTKREATLKANLEAIWNLSGQSSKNMAQISMSTEEALPFLISLMKPGSGLLKQMEKPRTIIEHASGILRNMAHHLSSRPELRKILRENECYEILLEQLKYDNMTVVGNACETLCRLSGGPDCDEDQRALLYLNAIPMLKSLVYSKDHRISQGSSTALRNLLSSKFAKEYPLPLDSRLSTPIYAINPPKSDKQYHSSGSESEHEIETGVESKPSLYPQQPPAAHQQSTSSAASLFQSRRNNGVAVTVPFHNRPPLTLSLSQSSSSGGGYRRSASANYNPEYEPLDLTVTSTKSSPIHSVTNNEFGTPHPPRFRPSQDVSLCQNVQSQSMYQVFKSPGRTQGQGWGFSYSGASFNRSCPEILTRFQQHSFPSLSQQAGKPLDFSANANSGSTSSSTHGGGEAAASDNILHEANEDADSTFNFSLRFAENDGDEETHHHHHAAAVKSEDTIITYCYEGTPRNFSKANSCQDLVQEVEDEPDPICDQEGKVGNKLQPIDEVKPYHVEDTPAAFSRASSLSSIHSPEEHGNTESNSFQEKNDPRPTLQPQLVEVPPMPIPRKRTSQSHTPCRVTFSAEETPLMFSRSSSVASLGSLDIGGGTGEGEARNDDELSDYSRRASEVVSPSELPDSPRALVPGVKMFEQNPTPAVRKSRPKKAEDLEDSVKVFTMEEKSGFNSCRSLSPLTLENGEELAVLGKDKLDSIPELGSSGACGHPSNIHNNHPSSTSVQLDSKGPGYQEGDEVRVFHVEGTPFYGVSTATSLSDLMTEIDEAEPPKPIEPSPISLDEDDSVRSKASEVQKAALALLMEEPSNEQANGIDGMEHIRGSEPNDNDAALLETCIRVGKAIGIPKSQSEFKIANGDSSGRKLPYSKTSENIHGGGSGPVKSKTGNKSKSQDIEFDDPDLAELIQIGRNRTTDKDKSNRNKGSKRGDKSKLLNSGGKSNVTTCSQNRRGDESGNAEEVSKDFEKNENVVQSFTHKNDEALPLSKHSPGGGGGKANDESTTDSSHSEEKKVHPAAKADQMQMSVISLGSEWNDETPTFSSPIPSMSMSTAFKLAGSVDAESLAMDRSALADPRQPQLEKSIDGAQALILMEGSCVSMSSRHELLENVEPPSILNNLMSSTDCIKSPHLRQKSHSSSLSDKLNKRWKALKEGADNSTCSNLAEQKPPIDYDMENSMISVASIKSEIYELSSESLSNSKEAFASAAEVLDGKEEARPCGGGDRDRDQSLGLDLDHTFTIFPAENANRLSGIKVIDLSEGKATVVSEDFTDAEDIEEYETAPLDEPLEKQDDIVTLPIPNPSPLSQDGKGKPLMEVRPLKSEQDNTKYNTFVVKKTSTSISPSPRSSPRQKRRDDPERYRTHTINPINMGKTFVSDANGNPDLKFATFRVGGPKIIKPGNVNIDSDSTTSPSSTPGQSPRSIRGRRKPLYSSLPPKAIVRSQNNPKSMSTPPPIPPKPNRMSSSPAKSGSIVGGGVFVRPTRTSELRAANKMKEHSSKGLESTSSRNSSNSSLNKIPCSSRGSETSVPCSSTCKPKVAPKPPARTTPCISLGQSHKSKSLEGEEGNNIPIQVRTSNSSFGFTRPYDQDIINDPNFKGYSTLPKSTRLGLTHIPFSIDRLSPSASSRDTIPGSEKSSKSSIGKITNLWKKMDFRSHKEKDGSTKNPVSSSSQGKKSSKLSNLFSRGKKDKTAPTQPIPIHQHQQPFRPPLPSHSDSAGNSFAPDCTPASASTSGIRVRRDGENKVIISSFNHEPKPKPTLQTRTSKITTV